MDVYIANYGLYFIRCHNLHQAHLQEVGMMQIPTNPAS